MESYARAIYASCVIPVVAGCYSPAASSGGLQITESDSSGITLVQINGAMAELPIVGLEEEPIMVISGDAPPFLGSIGEVAILSDGGLLIEDNQSDQIHQFDSSGDEVQVLGRQGEGPGEFQNILSLTVTRGDTAYVYDRRLYRLTQFMPDGALGFTLTVGRDRAGPGALVLHGLAIGSNRLLLHSMGPGESRWEGSGHRDQRDAVLQVVDGEGVQLRPDLAFHGSYSIQGAFGDARAPLTNIPFVSVRPDQVLYGSGVDYELVITDTALQPRRIIRWSGWRRPFTEEDALALADSLWVVWGPLRERRPESVDDLLEAMVSPDVLPDSLPALGAALLDDLGRIWVSDFVPNIGAWSHAHRSWHLLGPDGHPIAAVDLPPGQLAAVRGDRVAVILRDELDVEHVHVFRLRMTDPTG